MEQVKANIKEVLLNAVQITEPRDHSLAIKSEMEFIVALTLAL
jgi:hypothetical protein